MISIIFSLLLGVIAYFFHKHIRKHFNIIVIIATIFGVLSFILDFQLGTQGFLGLAFFVIVMFAGAFKKGSVLNKRFRSIRKEYSIIGFIVLLPHAIKFLLEFIDGSMPTEWYGIIAYVIMIPLFITSFTVIRKKMQPKQWFDLQRWAYLAYALTFIHLLMIGQSEHIIAYAIIFGLYSFLKLKNYVFSKSNQTWSIAQSLVVTGVLLFASLAITGQIGDLVYRPETIDLSEISDGTYHGEAKGFNNIPISLDVTVSNNEITDIVIYEHGATSPHRGINFVTEANNMADNIIQSQDTGIDSISGATTTTEVIQKAVIEALKEG